MSTDATADADYYSKLVTFILTLEKSGLKILIHIKHCFSSAKAIPIQEAQNLHCVHDDASDAENLCKWCLASLEYIFWEIFGTTLQDVCNVPRMFYLVIQLYKTNS